MQQPQCSLHLRPVGQYGRRCNSVAICSNMLPGRAPWPAGARRSRLFCYASWCAQACCKRAAICLPCIFELPLNPLPGPHSESIIKHILVHLPNQHTPAHPPAVYSVLYGRELDVHTCTVLAAVHVETRRKPVHGIRVGSEGVLSASEAENAEQGRQYAERPKIMST